MRDHSLGKFEKLVLLKVAALQGNAYGVSILEGLESHLKKELNISAVHVALKRMEEKSFVKSKFGGITDERGGQRKRYYMITPLGKRMLDEQAEESVFGG